MEDDRRLIAAALADPAAFRPLVAQYERLVWHVLARAGVSEADRSDLFQDVFLRVYEHLPAFAFRSKLSTWIARIAYNTALNHRAKHRLPLYDDAAPPDATSPVEAAPSPTHRPDAAAESADRTAVLRDEIDKLTPAQRTALTLYHLHDFDYREVAEAMDLPMGTVKSHLYRGRQSLKDALLDRFGPDAL